MNHNMNINAHLAVKQLSCERGGRLLFNDLSFVLHAGEILRVQGPNGSGKSSLLRRLTGLLPGPGDVHWCQRSMTDDAQAYQQQLIYIGHQPSLNAKLTARENLTFMTALAGYATDGLDEVLQAAGLGQQCDEYVEHLSAGQKRRIMLARLMAQQTPLWLLDEPHTALDQAGKAWLDDLCEAHLAHGGIVIMATHEHCLQQLNPQVLQLLGHGEFQFD